MAYKDKQPQQADFDKAWENIKAGKTMPTENDMGPLPTLPADIKKVKKEKTAVEVEKMKKGGCVKMAKGGSASKRADGCATKGKTKGRII